MFIYLPSDVQIDDVVDVIGILIGNEKHKEPLSPDGWFLSVNNVNGHIAASRNSEAPKDKNIYLFNHNEVPTMLTIMIDKNNLDRFKHECTYHFEGSYGSKEILCNDNEFWIKVGTALINFFGGKIEFETFGMEDIKAKKPRKSNSPELDKPWQDFQQEMFNLEPLKKEKK